MPMEQTLASEIIDLYQDAYDIVTDYENQPKKTRGPLVIPEDFRERFFLFIDKLNLRLMEDKDNFFGYFLFQMGRDIRFNLASPTGVNFKNAKYVMYFNPYMFLSLNPEQMESSIKHEILHVVSLHLLRARKLEANYSRLALNLAMDIVVNTYLDHLQPDAATLAWVNAQYALVMKPFETFEYYADQIQRGLDLLQKHKKGDMEGTGETDDTIRSEFDPAHTHDIWDESDPIDDQTLQKFTEKYAATAQKGNVSTYLGGMIADLKKGQNELPWHYYLKKIVGTVAAELKKTTTRRNRRQPDRLDLPGHLRNHKANIFIALDISGSISESEFKQAMQEVFQIVKSYDHQITIIECDNQIRRTYTVNHLKDLKERLNIRGGTEFAPVIEYANHHNIDLLVYFTDGKGEKKLSVTPQGYKILWVISGKGEDLSLEKPYGIVKKLKKVQTYDPSLDFDDVEKGGFSANNPEGMSFVERIR